MFYFMSEMGSPSPTVTPEELKKKKNTTMAQIAWKWS